MAALALRDITKVYAGGVAAVRSVTLDVPDGELLVLLGPSGCGKSTVLRLLAGLEQPTSGRVLIDQRDVTDVPPPERDLAMVFQSYALYPHKTVRDNMAFGLRMRGAAASQIERRVAEVAGMLGLEPLLDRRPAQLSGGQRQRVALGRAIVREPNAFLLDEPLSNVDPVRRVQTRTELALLHRRLAATMVYVTHDQEEAMTLGTRIAMMHAGRIEQIGTPLEVYRQPANLIVARFVGSPAMNTWTCDVVRDPQASTLRAPGLTLSIADPARAAAVDRRVVIGVRPQDVELVAPDVGEGRGRVANVESLGAVTVVHIDAGGGELVRVLVGPDASVQTGQLTGFRVRQAQWHLFEETTGKRVEFRRSI